MNEIPDITDSERRAKKATLVKCHGDQTLELPFTDARIRLKPARRELTTCRHFSGRRTNAMALSSIFVVVPAIRYRRPRIDHLTECA